MRSRIAGPFIRETKQGTEVSASKLNKVKQGDFIYSRLLLGRDHLVSFQQKWMAVMYPMNFPFLILIMKK
ncbi:hypothetical protein AU255_19400 [Methyloprofundus sedimenti]|uniref:Uncharacterized protein n=1 Tax=Methyloprofundus sedimenti TaxID=1420851 RepID=A0A1V8M0R6_9GAMM|nr:hypothetical protein [Methyloprofundus sedimenti]OQK15145.1 hypothetical protein AU255_19400 [Methyloprofundus sedimenti]